MAKTKVGIFGGTFNPIHVGHAILANHILTHCNMDQLWFMVTPKNPWKNEKNHEYDLHRINMVKLVAADITNTFVSEFEFTLPNPHYTADTMRALQERYPNYEFLLIIGADNWVAFDRWHNAEEILEQFKILVYPRLGFDCTSRGPHPNVQIIHAPIIEVSSSAIRQGIKEGKNMAFYLPDKVFQYIKNNHLYE